MHAHATRVHGQPESSWRGVCLYATPRMHAHALTHTFVTHTFIRKHAGRRPAVAHLGHNTWRMRSGSMTPKSNTDRGVCGVQAHRSPGQTSERSILMDRTM